MDRSKNYNDLNFFNHFNDFNNFNNFKHFKEAPNFGTYVIWVESTNLGLAQSIGIVVFAYRKNEFQFRNKRFRAEKYQFRTPTK